MAEAKKLKFVAVRAIHGRKPAVVPGSVIELTAEQANTAFYKNRVRLQDGQNVELTPAAADEGDAKKTPAKAGAKTSV